MPLTGLAVLATASISIAAPATKEITGTIEVNRRQQRLTGFGAATAFYQNWISEHPNKREIYNALFKGLKLDILRLQNVWRPTKGADFAKSETDIVAGARTALGHPIPILMSSWSPPGDLKSTHDEKNGGTLARINGSYAYDAFGKYWLDSLNAFRKVGIVPTYISIQNEPDWQASWESCLFKPTEQTENGIAYAGYDKALHAVYQRVKSLPHPPLLIGAEPTGIGDNKLEQFINPATPGGKEELRELYGLAHHLYNGGDKMNPDSFLPMLHGIRDAYPNKPILQTEFSGGDTLETAWLIHNCLVEENATAYFYWAAVWPDDGGLIQTDNPWKQSEWKHPHGWQYGTHYWSIKHYSYFTAPGWYRVDTHTGNNDIKLSAFVSPDRKLLTAVVLNTSRNSSAIVHLALHGFNGKRSSAVYRTTPAEHWKALGSLPADRSIVLPPRAIVTVTLGQ